MQHCTSVMSISTAPVMIASSCCRKLPATGMPWRMRISLAVQQMPARVTPFGARGLGFGHDLRVAGGDGEHFGQRGLMSVHEDVHRLRAQHAEVGPAPHRRRRPEENIGSDGGDARAAPAIRQRGPEGVQQEVPVVVVHPHVSPVQGLDHHAVDARGLDAPVAPHALAPDWCQLQGRKRVLLPVELRDKEIRQVERYRFLRSFAFHDAVEPRGIAERLLVGNAVGTALAFRHFLEQQHQVATMIRVRRGPARDFAHVVARHDRVRVRTAHAARRLGRDAAGPHVAQAAAHAVLAEGALVALGVHAARSRCPRSPLPPCSASRSTPHRTLGLRPSRCEWGLWLELSLGS